MVEESACNVETWVRSLGQEDPLEEGMATHSSTLACRVPWTEEPGGWQPTGPQRLGHDWSDWAHRQGDRMGSGGDSGVSPERLPWLVINDTITEDWLCIPSLGNPYVLDAIMRAVFQLTKLRQRVKWLIQDDTAEDVPQDDGLNPKSKRHLPHFRAHDMMPPRVSWGRRLFC